MIDEDPAWWATAIFTRDEVETLISHPEIQLDRRIVKISRARRGRGEVIALQVAAGVEGIEATDSDASRYSGRYSARNGGESHVRILHNARHPR